MEENKNSEEQNTQWAANILHIHEKNIQEMLPNELFANHVLITRTSCSRTGWQTNFLQVYMQFKVLHYYL